MIGFVRLAVLGFIGLSVFYLLLSIYSRSVRREELEKEWDGDATHEGAPAADRDAFIEAGMKAYAHSLRKKLIVLVYVIPVLIVGGLIYYVNW